MKEQLQHLARLLESLPSSNSCRGLSDLSGILGKYTRILDFVNSYNEDYKRSTTLYYSNITSIRDNIQQTLYGCSLKEKTMAFENARTELNTDIRALTILIHPQQELVAVSV